VSKPRDSSFTRAVMVLRIRCDALLNFTWFSGPLAGPKTSFQECNKHESMHDGHLCTRVLRSSFSLAVTLLCVHRAALHIFTRIRALLRVRTHAATLWRLGPIHARLTLRVCVLMYVHRSVHSLAIEWAFCLVGFSLHCNLSCRCIKPIPFSSHLCVWFARGTSIWCTCVCVCVRARRAYPYWFRLKGYSIAWETVEGGRLQRLCASTAP
jgi:hypothetical protein